jgi:hypothetical protein
VQTYGKAFMCSRTEAASDIIVTAWSIAAYVWHLLLQLEMALHGVNQDGCARSLILKNVCK